MSAYVQDRIEQQQAERQLLAADLVDHLTRAGHEARRVRIGTYPGVALWCRGGSSTVVLVDEDIVQWGRRWQHLARWRDSSATQLADRIVATLVRRVGAAARPGKGPRP